MVNQQRDLGINSKEGRNITHCTVICNITKLIHHNEIKRKKNLIQTIHGGRAGYKYKIIK